MQIKVNDRIKIKLYRGEEEFGYYRVISQPYVEEKSGVIMIKVKHKNVPGHFTIPVSCILEVVDDN